jgi:hypothetical protein
MLQEKVNKEAEDQKKAGKTDPFAPTVKQKHEVSVSIMKSSSSLISPDPFPSITLFSQFWAAS